MAKAILAMLAMLAMGCSAESTKKPCDEKCADLNWLYKAQTLGKVEVDTTSAGKYSVDITSIDYRGKRWSTESDYVSVQRTADTIDEAARLAVEGYYALLASECAEPATTEEKQ